MENRALGTLRRQRLRNELLEGLDQESANSKISWRELEELLHRSMDGSNNEQTGVLTALLYEYQDVFVTSTNPFGSITQHRIITGESKPINQAPR